MNCKHCGKPVTLAPSAQERARKYGETPEYYTRLFPTHSSCELKKRQENVSKLMEKHRAADDYGDRI